jgi:hypothetical protein
MGLVKPFASESAIQDQLTVLSGFIQSLSQFPQLPHKN